MGFGPIENGIEQYIHSFKILCKKRFGFSSNIHKQKKENTALNSFFMYLLCIDPLCQHVSTWWQAILKNGIDN